VAGVSLTQELLAKDVATLVRGTVLAQSSNVIRASLTALAEVEGQVLGEWRALQDQATALTDEAKASVGAQIKRLSKENLLKDLGVRGFLPAHGMPTGVASFIHKDQLAKDETKAVSKPRAIATTPRARSILPSAIMHLAPKLWSMGWCTVAGVTLNWQRPATDEDARDQSIKTFWTCPTCGAGDCGRMAPPHCPVCHSEIPLAAQRRFLEPAGFTVDMAQLPHADTDEVSFVETAPEEIVAKGAAWQPFADPLLGRMRASSDGMVFHSSRGKAGRSYDICLECGRAEPSADPESGRASLRNHRPLKTSKRTQGELCPGNDNPFKILRGLALGHEAVTDVAEIQPAGLPKDGAALAVAAALREALAVCWALRLVNWVLVFNWRRRG
jgi:hypothetical protein